MQPIYLDNNATTRTDPAVVEAMLPYFTEQFGNPSSSHAFGASVGEALKAARKRLAALLGAQLDHEIVFTSGGTEADNAAVLSALETQEGRDEVVTTPRRAPGDPRAAGAPGEIARRQGAPCRCRRAGTARYRGLAATDYCLLPGAQRGENRWR